MGFLSMACRHRSRMLVKEAFPFHSWILAMSRMSGKLAMMLRSRIQPSRTLQVCTLLSSKLLHLFVCRRRGRSLETNPYRKTYCVGWWWWCWCWWGVIVLVESWKDEEGSDVFFFPLSKKSDMLGTIGIKRFLGGDGCWRGKG